MRGRKVRRLRPGGMNVSRFPAKVENQEGCTVKLFSDGESSEVLTR